MVYKCIEAAQCGVPGKVLNQHFYKLLSIHGFSETTTVTRASEGSIFASALKSVTFLSSFQKNVFGWKRTRLERNGIIFTSWYQVSTNASCGSSWCHDRSRNEWNMWVGRWYWHGGHWFSDSLVRGRALFRFWRVRGKTITQDSCMLMHCRDAREGTGVG